MTLEKSLIRSGLTKPEAKTFLAALELGEASATQIAAKAGVKRPSVYLILETLKAKGLINTFKKRGKSMFYAEDPRVIERQLEERKQAVQDVLPELLSLANTLTKKPKIRYYEDDPGIEEIFKDMLNYPDSIISSWYSDAFKLFDSEFIYKYFIPKRREKKILSRSIMPDTKASRAIVSANAEELRQTKLIPETFFKPNIQINLYGGCKVAILSYKEKIGLIIESVDMFHGLKGIFDTMWHFVPGEVFPKK